MPIEFHCPSCSKRMRAAVDYVGRQTRCPTCGTLLIIPNSDGAIARAAAAAAATGSPAWMPPAQSQSPETPQPGVPETPTHIGPTAAAGSKSRISPLGIAAALLVVVGLAIGAWLGFGALSGEDSAVLLAPEDACGVIHVDMESIGSDLVAFIEKNRAQLEKMAKKPLPKNLDKELDGLEAITIYLAGQGEESDAVVVVRSTRSDQELIDAMKRLLAEAKTETPLSMEDLGNGRYKFDKREAGATTAPSAGSKRDTVWAAVGTGAGLEAGMVILSDKQPRVSADAIARMGKLSSDGRSALGKLGSSSPIRIAIWQMPGPKDPNAPVRIIGQISPFDLDPSFVELEFPNEEVASTANMGMAFMMAMFGLSSYLEVKNEDAAISIRFKPGGKPMADLVLEKIAEMEKKGMGAMAGMESNPDAEPGLTVSSPAPPGSEQQQAAARARLKRLLDAMKAYAENNNGHMPASLDALVKNRHLKADDLRMPGHTGPGYSFEYIRPLRDHPDASKKVMAWQRVSDYGGKGSMVLFEGWHVEWVGIERLRKLAADTLAAKKADVEDGWEPDDFTDAELEMPASLKEASRPASPGDLPEDVPEF